MLSPAALAAAMGVMGATMLPSALPLLRLDYATARSLRHTGAVVTGYALVWALLGAIAMEASMVDVAPAAVAAALGCAALYQASPLARRCLTRCRTPLARIVLGWRDGPRGGFAMGVRDGLWCAGCCAGLVVAFVALGAVSVRWMVVFGALAAVEKVAPFGRAAHAALAGILAVAAVAVA